MLLIIIFKKHYNNPYKLLLMAKLFEYFELVNYVKY